MANKPKVKTEKLRSRDIPSLSPSETIDAIALLQSDHLEVSRLFDAYQVAGANAEKKTLADRICLALKIHAQIEEELLYPAARERIDDVDLIDEALVEHMGAKTLVAQIETMRPGQPLYDAKVKVLGEQVRHHVEEEEAELFPAVRETNIDLDELGARLAARKAELTDLLAPIPVV